MLNDFRCNNCGHIVWRFVFRGIKRQLVSFRRRFKRCKKCGKRGVYARGEGKWLCWDCWSEGTGLPF